jgi:O-antigen/teichoic acid export membrane protein
VANLVTGVSTAALSLFVPPVLSRLLSRDEFSAWTLILQLATYTALLNLGTQGAVSRYVAYHLARGDRRSGNEFVSAAMMAMVGAAVAALAIVVLVSINIGRLFPALPAGLVTTSSIVLFIAGSTLALGIPTSTLSGVFTGAQRNEIVAIIQGSTRLILAGLLIAAAMAHEGMVAMAMVFCVVNILGYLAYWLVNRRLAIVDISFSIVTRAAFQALAGYCGTFVVWMLSMFLINGIDVVIVGRLNFTASGVYGACYGPILMIAGIQQALFGPLLQFGAAHSVHRTTEQMQQLLIRATRLSTVLLLCMSVPLIIFSRELMELWLGRAYAAQGSLILRPMLIGHVIRLLGTPYALLLLATLQHKRVVLTPVIEGITNVAVAVWAGLRFGAVGVAYGVVVGAFVSQLLSYLINMPKTTELVGDREKLLGRGIGLPLLCFAPAILLAILVCFDALPHVPSFISVLILVFCAVLSWKWALEPDERCMLVDIMSRVKRAWA